MPRKLFHEEQSRHRPNCSTWNNAPPPPAAHPPATIAPMIRQFLSVFLAVSSLAYASAGAQTVPEHATILHAAHLLDVASGKLISPGEVLVRGNLIVAAGTSVEHPAGAEVIDLGGLRSEERRVGKECR